MNTNHLLGFVYALLTTNLVGWACKPCVCDGMTNYVCVLSYDVTRNRHVEVVSEDGIHHETVDIDDPIITSIKVTNLVSYLPFPLSQGRSVLVNIPTNQALKIGTRKERTKQ